jgi:Ca2+-binding RTX toxin-like protein
MNKIKRGILLGGLAAGLLAAAPVAGNASVGEPVVTRSGAKVTITAPNVNRADNITIQEVSGRLHVFGSVVAGAGCTTVSSNEVDCGTGVTTLNAGLGAGNDRFSSLMSLTGFVDGGAGTDIFEAGRAPRGTSLNYLGGAGTDTVDYGSSSIGVNVTKNNSSQPDGRPGIDRDNVAADVEIIRGTVAADTLIGSNGFDLLDGDQGADTLRGLGGDDIIDAVDVQNIKDKVIDCGDGNDTALVNAADAPVACETVTRS